MEITRSGEKYMVAEGYEWFWKMFSDGSWEPTTFKIFDKFLDKEKTFVDIGAWIGPTVLYAASRVKEVFAFEPDPVAFFGLIKNLELNKITNVVPYSVAVSDKWKAINFGAKGAFGDSMASELWAKGDTQVPAISFGAIIEDCRPNFVKIDIEGGEKSIFKNENNRKLLEFFRPTIHLSLHTPWFKDDLSSYMKAIVDGLEMYPYFYDQDLNPIDLKNVFDINAFNSIVATFKKI